MANIAQTQNQVTLFTRTKILDRLGLLLFSSIIIVILGYAWLVKDRGYITAESGLGYYLGITGGVMMLVMLLYSARKHLRFMHSMGAQKYWFRFHMMSGVLGPSLVIVHTNFNMGSTNSSIALICMLLVAGSGLIGRLIYTKIHLGLYGKKLTLKGLQEDINNEMEVLGITYKLPEEISSQLHAIEERYIEKKRAFINRLWLFATISLRIRLLFMHIKPDIRFFSKSQAKNNNLNKIAQRKLQREIGDHVWHYLITIRKIVQLIIYDRLFGLWHVVHIPIFFMMLITAITHVIAVHLY